MGLYLHHKSITHTNIQKVIDKNNLKTKNMSYNLSQIMKSAHRNYKKGGKTFSECLKSAWSFAKLQESFSPEAVKTRTDKFLAERHEAISKAAKATPSEEYDNKNIPASAYYNPNSTGKYGAHYVGD